MIKLIGSAYFIMYCSSAHKLTFNRIILLYGDERPFTPLIFSQTLNVIYTMAFIVPMDAPIAPPNLPFDGYFDVWI